MIDSPLFSISSCYNLIGRSKLNQRGDLIQIEQIRSFFNSLTEQETVKRITQHQLAGLLYIYTPELRSSEEFKKQWMRQWHRAEILKSAYDSLQEELPKDITFTPLKGISFLDRLYPDKGTRFLSDIDILVHPKDLSEFQNVLKKQNYSLNKKNSWMGDHFKEEWCKEADHEEIVVELHTQLFMHKDYDLQIPLSVELELIYLIYHYAYQHNFLRLYWLVDIYLFIEKYKTKLDFKKLHSVALSLDLRNSLYMTLKILENYFSLSIPLEYPRKTTKLVSKEFLLSDDMTSWSYYLMKHRTKDSLKEALAYDFQWVGNKLKRLT